MSETNTLQTQVHTVLEDWARATRQNRKDKILKNHAIDLVIFDVLSPMKYESKVLNLIAKVGVIGSLKLRVKCSLIWKIYL